MAGLGILFKLPPELRIQVYNYTLGCHNEKVHVIPTLRRKPTPEAIRGRVMYLNQRIAEGRPRKPVSVKNALLYVSEHVSHEACAVLYGEYKFILTTAQALDWFLAYIGENKQHIRQVQMTGSFGQRQLRALGRITDNLMTAKGLRSLTVRIDRNLFGGLGNAELLSNLNSDISKSDVGAFIEKLALMSTKLLKALHAAQESEDKITGVLAIVQLEMSECPEAVRQKISMFWIKTVELCISNFKP